MIGAGMNTGSNRVMIFFIGTIFFVVVAALSPSALSYAFSLSGADYAPIAGAFLSGAFAILAAIGAVGADRYMRDKYERQVAANSLRLLAVHDFYQVTELRSEIIAKLTSPDAAVRSLQPGSVYQRATRLCLAKDWTAAAKFNDAAIIGSVFEITANLLALISLCDVFDSGRKFGEIGSSPHLETLRRQIDDQHKAIIESVVKLDNNVSRVVGDLPGEWGVTLYGNQPDPVPKPAPR